MEPQQPIRSASSNWCYWGSRRWASPAWCCASSKASFMNSRRAPSEVRHLFLFQEENGRRGSRGAVEKGNICACFWVSQVDPKSFLIQQHKQERDLVLHHLHAFKMISNENMDNHSRYFCPHFARERSNSVLCRLVQIILTPHLHYFGRFNEGTMSNFYHGSIFTILFP